MPTRLPVLLHRRKSAAAGVANAIGSSAQATSAARRHAPDTRSPILIPPTRIIRLAISRRFHLAVNEDGAEVIDVGEGWAWDQEIAQALEEARGVVVGKKHGRIEAELLRPRGSFSVHTGSGRILRGTCATIRSVSIACKGGDPPRAGKRKRQRQRILLVGATATFAADCHRQFTT